MGVEEGGTLIFTAVTKGFLSSLLNWVTLLYRLDLKNVFVYAMDDVHNILSFDCLSFMLQ